MAIDSQFFVCATCFRTNLQIKLEGCIQDGCPVGPDQVRIHDRGLYDAITLEVPRDLPRMKRLLEEPGFFDHQELRDPADDRNWNIPETPGPSKTIQTIPATWGNTYIRPAFHIEED